MRRVWRCKQTRRRASEQCACPKFKCWAVPVTDSSTPGRLLDTNPNSFRKLVATFLEANGRGYWDASEDQLDRLRQLYMDVEDKIEGVE